VDVCLSQRGKLGPAKASESCQENQRAVAGPDLLGQQVNLGHGQDRPLRGDLSVSALDPARIAADEPVIERRIEDRPQQAVCLSCRYLARTRVEQFLAPAADPRQGDLSNGDALEVRRDVGAQKVAVEPDRLGAQAGTLVDPGRAVLGYEYRARVGIDPVAVADL